MARRKKRQHTLFHPAHLHQLPVRLAAGVVATLKFWVVGKEK